MVFISLCCFLPTLAILPPAGEFDPWKESAVYEIEYRVDAASLLVGKPEKAALWLPLAMDGDSQSVLDRKIHAPWKHREAKDQFGNQYAYFEPTRGEGDATVAINFRVERRVSRGTTPAAVVAGSANDPKRFLAADRLVPIDGVLAEKASAAVAGAKTDAERIEALYRHVVGTMTYKKEGQGWGRGDAVWACNSQYGNCTDFHAVLIAMARSQHVPARFSIGFPIPADKIEGEIPGYHCWAELYDSARGWVPMDASEARKSGKTQEYLGTLPSDRVEFTVGRDLVLDPRQAGEPLNFVIYPYAEVNGKPWAEKLPLKVTFRRIAKPAGP